tara:strand:+ start:13816 stop:14604 length:789 start_codon:yes stop_codon:yes gene_type:complete
MSSSSAIASARRRRTTNETGQPQQNSNNTQDISQETSVKNRVNFITILEFHENRIKSLEKELALVKEAKSLVVNNRGIDLSSNEVDEIIANCNSNFTNIEKINENTGLEIKSLHQEIDNLKKSNTELQNIIIKTQSLALESSNLVNKLSEKFEDIDKLQRLQDNTSKTSDGLDFSILSKLFNSDSLNLDEYSDSTNSSEVEANTNKIDIIDDSASKIDVIDDSASDVLNIEDVISEKNNTTKQSVDIILDSEKERDKVAEIL